MTEYDGSSSLRDRSRLLVMLKLALVSALLICPFYALKAYGAGLQTTKHPEEQHSLVIQSQERLQIITKEDDKEWYEHGIWPLIGAMSALIITNSVAVAIVYLQSSKGFKAVLRQRKIEALSTALNEFYNPLLALTEINGEIFSKTGPPSFPEDGDQKEAAALVWKFTKEKILVNNRQIETILRTKTHLLHVTDALEHYHALMIHVAMYEAFQKVETDLYRQFLFPKNVRKHISKTRSVVISEFTKLSGEQT